MSLPIKPLAAASAVLLFLAGWVVQHYANPLTPCWVRLLVTMSFWLGFSGIALLPLDLSITQVYYNEEYHEPNDTYIPWLFVYWITFPVAFGLLPVVREALLSGRFTYFSRIRDGIRKTIRRYLLILLVAVAAIIALAIQLRSWHILSMLMAIGNTYGLLLVSVLLGYGLVDLPRSFWRLARPAVELRRSQIMTGAADEALFDAVWELQDCEELIDTTIIGMGDYEAGPNGTYSERHYQYCVEQLLAKRNFSKQLSPELQSRRTGHSRRHDTEPETNDTNALTSETRPSKRQLADLNARLQKAIARLMQAEQRWNELVDRSIFFSSLTNGELQQTRWPEQDPLSSSCCSRCGSCIQYFCSLLRYYWMYIFRSTFYRLMAFGTAILSAMVLWSEATLSSSMNLSPFALLMELFSGYSGLISLVPLLYMSLCVYNSIFKLSIFGNYCLRGYKQSHAVALVFNAQYLMRLQFPLGYNYLFLIKYDTTRTDCAFSRFMSGMETIPFFGTSFSVYAPLLIIALGAFTLCNGYPRLLAALGIEHEDSILVGDQETLDGKVNEAITLLRRAGERGQNGHSESKSLYREASMV